MQFFLDGFRPGDPTVMPAVDDGVQPRLEDAGEVDVLIVGSGPAGLVLAAQLSRFPSIRTRVVERRDGPLALGQADGVACRTVEILAALGLGDQLLREAYWVNETTFWQSDPTAPGQIVRTGRVQDVEDGISEFPHVILNQARVLEHLLGAMRRSPRRLTPDYGVSFAGLTRRATGSHPVTVALDRGGSPFTVDARYVIGCDGAHSGVRHAIGREMHGEAANHAWGVMDVLAQTDFPDFRLKSAIQSAEGSIVVIPREGGYLTRFYVDVGEVTSATHDRIRSMTADDIVRTANRILAPYTLEVRDVVWFSIYEVVQRLTDAFDDAHGEHEQPRVFIAGDACHTHSAKAGQGMNVSIQDAFNLGWKLAAVLEGRSGPELLDSFTAERQPVARELIEFDREWSALLASAPSGSPEVQDGYVRQGRYTAGVATRYGRSRLTGDAAHQALAPGLRLGMRFHSAEVIRIADARRLHLGHVAPADGRWRIYAFGDAAQTRMTALCEWLTADDASPIRRCTPPGGDVDAVIDVRGVLQRPHRSLDVHRLPPLLLPRKGRLGLVDYEKAFTAPPSMEGNIFDARGIDRERGCAVIVRPDQFVSHVLPLDAFDAITAFFEPLLVPVPASATSR